MQQLAVSRFTEAWGQRNIKVLHTAPLSDLRHRFPTRRLSLKPVDKALLSRLWPLILIAVVTLPAGRAWSAEAPLPEVAAQAVGLMGDWCLVRKRMVTKYTVRADRLLIRGGRSGHLHEADLRCDETYSTCEAKTVRGWGTPVTETLRLDGDNMSLTRVWGGSWNGKTYNFSFTRCPKW